MTAHMKAFTALPTCLATLAEERRWVGWKWETRADKQGNQKRTKPPRMPGGGYAHNDKPDTWATFAEVGTVPGFDGVGLQLLRLNGFAALDLDNVRDPETGAVLSWASEVIACGSYAEATPSGNGFRVLGTVATDHAPMHRKFQHPEGGEIEFYVSMETGRYITVTGQRVAQAPDALNPIDGLISRLWDKVQPKQEDAPKLDFNAAPADAGRATGFDDLPEDLRKAIAYGVNGDRSCDFQGIANALYARVDFLTALSILEAHPQGPAGKYAGRLEKELRRSWNKAAASFTPSGTQNGPTMATPEVWEEPDPKYLTDMLPEPPTLPLEDVFGAVWARWIRAAAKGAPPDYVVAALLSVTGSLIGNTRWAAPWSGWSEPPIIWSVAIGNPSAGKSRDSMRCFPRSARSSGKPGRLPRRSTTNGRAGPRSPSCSNPHGKRRSRRPLPTARSPPQSPPRPIPVRNRSCRAMRSTTPRLKGWQSSWRASRAAPCRCAMRLRAGWATCPDIVAVRIGPSGWKRSAGGPSLWNGSGGNPWPSIGCPSVFRAAFSPTG